MGNGSGVGHVGERQQSGLTTILSSCSEAGHCLCFQGTPEVGTPPLCLVLTASFDVTSPIDMMSSVSLPHSPLCGSLFQWFLLDLASECPSGYLICLWFVMFLCRQDPRAEDRTPGRVSSTEKGRDTTSDGKDSGHCVTEDITKGTTGEPGSSGGSQGGWRADPKQAGVPGRQTPIP